MYIARACFRNVTLIFLIGLSCVLYVTILDGARNLHSWIVFHKALHSADKNEIPHQIRKILWSLTSVRGERIMVVMLGHHN